VKEIPISAALRDAVAALAEQAGAAIMEVYAGDFDVASKSDASPLTIADLRAHEVIVTGLGAMMPKWPVLSEESANIPFADRGNWRTYWLVDPLDGTREFISRNGEFTVNVALIHDHVPILGVVHVPASSTTYAGGNGLGAQKRAAGTAFAPIHPSIPAQNPIRVVGSRSHRGDSLEAFLSRLNFAHEFVPVGSALKFCLVAEGRADVYPRLGPTSEWDTAAAQAIVEAAGGIVCELNGVRLRYNTKPDTLNPNFIVYADRSRDWLAAAKAAD